MDIGERNMLQKFQWALAVVFLSTGLRAADRVYQAPSPEPSPEETLILEYINRFRSNPAVEGERVLPADGKPVPLCPGFDVKVFRDEIKELKAAPPLVFNLALLDGARKHANYMLLNGQGHHEVETQPGFTGKAPWDRAHAAGYPGMEVAENVARDLLNPWHTLQGFVIDWRMGGPNGMLKGRGHRVNLLTPTDREVGVGALPHRAGLATVQNFGNRPAARFIGGVVYADNNNNNFYDTGEGIEGVSITTGNVSIASWSSGAYAIELPNTEAVTITFTWDKQTQAKTFPAGTENLKCDWIIDAKIFKEQAKANAPAAATLNAEFAAKAGAAKTEVFKLETDSKGGNVNKAAVEELRKRLETLVRTMTGPSKTEVYGLITRLKNLGKK
jgi:hypothetical protein